MMRKATGELQLWRGRCIRDRAGGCRRRPEAVEPRLVDALRLVRDDAALADGAHDLHDPEAGDLQAWGDGENARPNDTFLASHFEGTNLRLGSGRPREG